MLQRGELPFPLQLFQYPDRKPVVVSENQSRRLIADQTVGDHVHGLPAVRPAVDHVSEEDDPVIELPLFGAGGYQTEDLPEEIGVAVDVADGECV